MLLNKTILVLIILCLQWFDIISQERWSTTYLDGLNPFGESICTYYDKGYLIAGRYGPNYPKLNWLIKTDVNGEILWNKTLGNGSDNIVLSLEVKADGDGNIYLAGLTDAYNLEDYDPLVMKLNSCGEKEWCKVYYKEGLNHSNDLVITTNNNVVVILRYMSTEPWTDRICLSKLDKDGIVQWTNCYNSPDSNLYNDDAKDLIMTPDGGFLITGRCYYEDPKPPHYWWAKPYYIKTDSMGNFEWETIVHKNLSDIGGFAWNSVINHDSTYYYSSLSHFYFDQAKDAPALLKMDMHGNVIDIYDIAPPNEYGKMIELALIDENSLAASATWGTEANHTPRAIVIDTLGNLLYQNVLLDNDWLAETAITFDKKLLYFTNKYIEEYDQFDAYLFKLNTQLESDTFYTQQFNYDSLCPYPIVSDTIVQDNCGLIVGDEEIISYQPVEKNEIRIYPNPARDMLVVGSSWLVDSEWVIEVFDLFGRKVKEIEVSQGQEEAVVDVSDWQKGLYLVRVSFEDGTIGSGKVVVE